MCLPRLKIQSPMSQSLYKSTINFLIQHSKVEVKGNHLRRLQVLASMVSSCITTKSSTLEGLSLPQEESEFDQDTKSSKQSESCVKQTKRWLSSKWTDWNTFFAPYIGLILVKMAEQKELIFIMDGSETASGCVTLMLSVIWKGYAIPVFWLTREGSKGHFTEQMHLELLKGIKAIVPINCRIVLLGDGEFDGSKLRACCREWGWEFVLRTSTDRNIDCGTEIGHLGSLYPDKYSEVVFVEDACEGDNAILWQAKGFDSPIPLLTNMDLGEMACAYYRHRFKIETLFKQFKSAGFQLQKSMVEGANRVQNLILVVSLAFIFTFCAGILLKSKSTILLKKIIRVDKVKTMRPVTLTQKCIDRAWMLVLNIFYEFFENWAYIFSLNS